MTAKYYVVVYRKIANNNLPSGKQTIVFLSSEKTKDLHLAERTLASFKEVYGGDEYKVIAVTEVTSRLEGDGFQMLQVPPSDY